MAKNGAFLFSAVFLAVAGLAAAGDPAPAPPSPAGSLRLRTVRIDDRPEMIGGEAVTFLAPAEWKVEGGIQWRPHPVLPAGLAVRVFDPRGLGSIQFFPALPFSYGPHLGPGTFFPVGSNYLGNEVRPAPRDAFQFLKEIFLPRARPGVAARIVKEEDLPKVAEAVRAANPGGPGAEVKVAAGKVRLAYEVDGKPVEEDIYCALVITRLPASGITIWMADKLAAARAEKGKLDATTKVLQTAAGSARVNLAWFNRYAQLVQALTRAQMDRIRSAGELSRYIARTSSEISDMMRKSYEERQASQDRINKNFSQYMRGVDEYRDPSAGRSVELPSGYREAWAGGNGEFIVSDDPNFDPNVELKGDWRKLEKKEP